VSTGKWLSAISLTSRASEAETVSETVRSITGIELGPESCVLVRARSRRAAVEVSTLHQIARSAWPASHAALSATLRQQRKAKRFPRRARLVVWALAEPLQDGDPVVRSLVAPVAAAGFRVERVLTPPEALAEIARTRSRGRGVAVAWLALNMHGAAVAIVRDGELLYGRTFEWHYAGHARDPRGELLQRYSLVAHLAPEVRHGMTQARRTHGAIVEAAVTIGDLPDLRSLTMPLIEELDLEVETLDSTEGFAAAGRARSGRFAESAPAIRLATAAATISPAAGRRASGIGPVVRIAAATGIVAAVGWLGYRSWVPTAPAPAVAQKPVPSLTKPPSERSTPQVERPADPPSPVASKPVASQPRYAPPATVNVPVPSPAKPPAATPVDVSGRDRTMDPAPQRAEISMRKPLPIEASLPSVESILVASDRRVARIDGRIVTVGGRVGPRVVAGIEPDAVVFEDPSGHQIRVPIRRGRGAE
jgi:hypothetical protein